MNKTYLFFLGLALLFSCTLRNNNFEYLVDGKDTIYKEYFKSGETKFITDIQNGKYNGRYMSYREAGSLERTGLMKNGRKNGVWKTYDKNENLVKVEQFFDDSPIYQLDKNDFVFIERIIKSENIKIKVPQDWETKEYRDQLILTVRKNCSNAFKFCPNISLTKQDLNDETDFKKFIEDNLHILSLQIPEFKIITENNFEVNGIPAFQITYIMKNKGVRLGSLTTWFKVDSRVYVLSGMALNEEKGEFLRYKGLFEEITNSFEHITYY